MNATERRNAAFKSWYIENKRLKSELAQRLPTRHERDQLKALQAEVERLNSMLERARDVLGRVFVACGCSPVDATADWYEEMLLSLSDETVEPLLKEIELARLRAIERLKAEVDRLRAALGGHYVQVDHLKMVEADNERIRSLLLAGTIVEKGTE